MKKNKHTTSSHRTRIGKIARLPAKIREQLNRRLQDGEPGDQLLDWLNDLPATQKILDAQFGGRPISKQNLSEWKQGGYIDWQRAEEDRLRVDRLTKQAAQLVGDENVPPLSERLAAVFVVELTRALDALKDESLPLAEHWQLLREMLRELAQMRREDNRAARLRIEQARWRWENEKQERKQDERLMKEAEDELCAPYKAWTKMPYMTELYGGGEMGRKIAAHVLEIKHDLKPGTLCSRAPSDSVKQSPTRARARKPSRAQSKPVKPNPAEDEEDIKDGSDDADPTPSPTSEGGEEGHPGQ